MKGQTLRYLDRLQPLGLLIARVVLGAIMIAHGYPKVFHGGLHKTTAMVASMGMPGWLGYPLAATEFLGGILLVVGLLTRYVSVAVLIDMTVAILKVHLKNGFTGPGNYQFPLALAAMALLLILYGGGAISLDWLFTGAGQRSTRAA
jgi:putative oxidoreductase